MTGCHGAVMLKLFQRIRVVGVSVLNVLSVPWRTLQDRFCMRFQRRIRCFNAP